MKTSTDEQLTRRFYLLNGIVTFLLLIAIVLSISQFGQKAWGGNRQIGFILVGSKNDPGWNHAQATGAQNACDQLGYDLLLQENVPANGQNLQQTVRDLVDRGAQVVFYTYNYPEEMIEQLALEYPRVQFYGVDATFSGTNINSYSVRYLELRYLSGILAGLHTKNNRIGYIAPFPQPEILHCINAFTLGVRKVNPNAQVFLVWTGDWNNPTAEEQAVHTLKAAQIDLLTYHQDSDVIPLAAERTAIPFISYHESYPSCTFFLAGIKGSWQKIYTDILRRHYRQSVENRDWNYWPGLPQGCAGMEIAKDKLTFRERAVLESEQWALTHGALIFTEEIYDRDGIRRCEAGESISGQYLRTQMDWLIKGVNVIGY